MKSSLPAFWEHFSFQHEKIEENVQVRPGSYQGIKSEALYTSDQDLLSLFNHPLIHGTFCDLGCGTGKAALLYGSLFPARKSIGMEFETARLKIGMNFKEQYLLNNVELIQADLLSAELPKADCYFLYFPTGVVLDRLLSALYELQRPFNLIVIESHGDLIPRIEKENWLEFLDEIALTSARHHPFMKIYGRTSTVRDIRLLPFTVSFLERYLLIEENNEQWLGESYGLEWTRDDRFELQTPPRTVFWKDVKKLMLLEEIEPLFHAALWIRRLGIVEIKTMTSTTHAYIRKIIIGSTFRLELSSGEKVEWSQILTITQGSKICYVSSLAS